MVSRPKDLKSALRASFPNFIKYVWAEVIHLPPPTRTQLDIARFLESGPNRRAIEGFRGVGKSFLTCSYVVWQLWRNPQWKVLIVSAGESGATSNATLIKAIIEHQAGDDLWGELRPRRGQRSSTLAFDVGPAVAAKQPSVSTLGIGGQLAGNRADILISDDVENQRNSMTEDQRDKLKHGTSEFGKILVPDDHAQIIYLGTPQTEESIYNDLPKRGYAVRVWPARYPLREKVGNYADTLAPMVLADMERDPSLCLPTGLSTLAGAPVDPQRFSDAQLLENELDGTAAEFLLQMMLDTTLSDAERYPLKTSDLIVMDVDPHKAPVHITYTSDPNRQIKTLPNIGFSGDRFYRPMDTEMLTAPYTGSVMHIDPSGTGQDETGYVVTKFLEGRIFVTAWGGLTDGTSPETLETLATIAREQEVNLVVTEDNWGDGMFRQLLSPVLARKHTSRWRCGIEGRKVRGQKEKRIMGALEPVMKQHRLIIDLKVIENDLKAAPTFQGLYQMTHLTTARGSLKHDDRIDVLGQSVEYWRDHMNADIEKSEANAKAKADREFEKKFFAGTTLGRRLEQRGRQRGMGRRR